jgi:ankyrin repeat protein
MRLALLILALSAKMLLAAADAAAAEMLTKAIRLGDMKTAESLLSSGVDPNAPDKYGQTPLTYAVSFNQTQLVELLLAYHADPNLQLDGRGERESSNAPLQYAAESGNVRIASILIAAGAQVNAQGPTGRTPLHFANGKLAVIQLLLAKGADPNARDAQGTSPLDEAVWYGFLDETAILLAHGARLNEIEPKTGATPINEAAYKGHTRLVEYLLRFHPDLGIPDKNGYRPLDNAIRTGKEDSAVLLLDAEPKEQETPLFFDKTMEAAVRKDESLLLEALLRRGASANAILPAGSTALDTAAFTGAEKVVGVLLNNHADPNLTGPSGTYPLEDASLQGFDTLVEMLLNHGALVNRLSGSSGTTALYSAASFGKGKTAKLLLQHRANPNLCGSNRKTPYQAALANGFSEVADEIKRAGGTNVCER